jgi:prophage maintenance system killer protein
LFLTLNRCRLKAGKAAAVKTMLAVAAGTLDERGLAAWIQAHIEPA